MRRRLAHNLPIAAAIVALAGCSSDETRSAGPPQAEVQAALEGSPAPLAAVHRQANELLDGGAEAFRARLRELRGHPVVVNKWASWCGPCRLEFPIFQRVSVQRGKQIAFLGVDAEDTDRGARQLLDEFPLSFPSYRDPGQEISGQELKAVAFPSTAFYDSKGKLAYVRQGPYRDDRDLIADIERYAR
jgi:thiol-disulfide isomerase/thioredoxin